MIVSVLGVMVARRSRAAAPFTAFFALWGLGSVFFYVVASPLGDNWTRLDAFVFPVMLLTAALADFKPRGLVVLACACAFAYNVVPYVLLIPSRLDNNTQQASYWAPAIHFLRDHQQPGYRVEVVPTAEHWEADWIPTGRASRSRAAGTSRSTRSTTRSSTRRLSTRQHVRRVASRERRPSTSCSPAPRRSTGTAARARRRSSAPHAAD